MKPPTDYIACLPEGHARLAGGEHGLPVSLENDYFVPAHILTHRSSSRRTLQLFENRTREWSRDRACHMDRPLFRNSLNRPFQFSGSFPAPRSDEGGPPSPTSDLHVFRDMLMLAFVPYACSNISAATRSPSPVSSA